MPFDIRKRRGGSCATLVLFIIVLLAIALSSSCKLLGKEPPEAPDRPHASALSSSEIRLTWHDNSDNETGFIIEYGTSEDQLTRNRDVDADEEEYTVYGLSASTRYYFRICAENEDGASAFTDVIDVTTLEPVAPAHRTFRARTAIDGSWYDVSSRLLGVGDHALVYVEDGAGVTASTAQSIASQFDTRICGVVRDNFGHESDVDENDRIILLLLDIVDGFSGYGGYVAGYFDATHLFSKSTYPDSNEADMLFLDTYPAVPASDSFYMTAAHEMQHLVNFANTYMVDGRQQDLWINEGLSSGAEYLYAEEQVASRIDYYNADPYETIRYGNNFFVWNGYWEQMEGDFVANYATVYLFFQWLRIHASNDSGIYKEILLSSYRDYNTVVAAASTRLSGTLDSWEKVLRAWLHANFLNSASGLTGYAGEITTASWCFYNTGGVQAFLSSGESVVIETTDGSFTYEGGSGSSIRYNGISTVAGAIDTVGPDYDGDFVLVFNSNSQHSAEDQIAVLPSVQLGSTASLFCLAVPQEASLPDSYPVDVTFELGGGLAPDSHWPPAVPGRGFRADPRSGTRR